MNDTPVAPGPPREDPGWPRPGVRDVLAALMPGTLHRRATDDTVPAIVAQRRVFLGFLVAPVVVILVLSVAVEVRPTSLDDLRAWGLVTLGVLTSIGGPSAARRRRLVCASPASIARQVSSVMFFGIATAQSAALLGFVAAFVTGAVWPYVVALVPTAVGLARIAPTRRRIADLDAGLDMVGCPVTASQVLYAEPGDAASPTAGEPRA